MNPQAVARILESKQMNEETFIMVLSMMDPDAAAAVLENVEPGLAGKLTERLRTLQQPPGPAAERRSKPSRPMTRAEETPAPPKVTEVPGKP
jgi:flagellar motility protein MotE (MotC chaperone)